MITPYPKVHRTRFAELGYWQVEPGCWSFVNFDEDGTPHQVSVDAGGAGETRRDQRRAAKKLRAVIEGTLDRYAGSTQVHLIGDDVGQLSGMAAGERCGTPQA